MLLNSILIIRDYFYLSETCSGVDVNSFERVETLSIIFFKEAAVELGHHVVERRRSLH